MKQKLLSWAKLSVFVLGFLVLNSCSDTYNITEVIQDTTIIQFRPHIVKAEDWRWNNARGRYEAIVDFPQLTAHMYDNGVLNVSTFIGTGANEVQTPLPYIETWKVANFTYTETVSYDVSLSTRTIAYYIQASDLQPDDYYLTDYEFKLSFIFQ